MINAPPIELDPGATWARAQSASNQKTAKKFTKHDTYWLLSGDIFVQIDKIRFKLHQYTLVKHSKWFRDMIETHHTTCAYTQTKRREPLSMSLTASMSMSRTSSHY